MRGIERKWEEKETARQTDSRKILRERERLYDIITLFGNYRQILEIIDFSSL